MNYFRRHIILVFFICLSLLCRAQTTIKGQVKDGKGHLCPDISVVVTTTTAPPQIIGYVFTDEKGNYSIQFKSEEKQIKIRFTGFNIQRVEAILPNHSTTINQTVKEEAINLKEVSVKADKIWQQGDTLNYNVTSFMSNNDISIGDVLKRMPGISVKPSGTIEYKGKAISKFYIEGMDLLKGRYGIATNNIPPSSISTVQVLENHQEVKALKSLEFPDAAAINIKLKDTAKGIFNLIAQLGLGTDKNMLWENELIGTYFTRKRQHFITYKNNNNGKELLKELTSLTETGQTLPEQFLQMEIPKPPGIEQSKYYFNNTNAASINNVWKTSKGYEINANFVYLNDHEKRNSYEQTNYMLPDGSQNIIMEQMSSATTTDKIEGNISYKRNEENNYLANDISLLGTWERGCGNIMDKQNIDQTVRMNTFRIFNKLHWIRKQSEYKGIEINSRTGFGIKPQNLYVHPNLFYNLFPNGEADDKLYQDVKNTNFTSRNSVSFLTAWMIGDIRINPTGLLYVEYDGLKSDLSAAQNTEKIAADKKFQNNADFYNVEGGISFDINYNSGHFKCRLFLPATFNYNYLKQKKQESNMKSSKVLVSPSASIRYQINAQWEIATSYDLNYEQPEIQQLYGGYILTNYRNLNSFEASLDKPMYQNMNLKINYKDVVNMLFTGINVAYGNYKPNILHGYNLDGVLLHTITHRTEKHGDNLYANLRLSKGFFWKSLKLELENTWYKNQSPQLRQDKEVYYQSQGVAVIGKINISPFTRLSLHYQGAWQWSQSQIKDSGKFPISRTFTNKATAKVNILDNLTLSGSIDHYYNNQIEGNKSFSLMDAEVSYKWKTTQFFLTWDNIFDINKYIYSYTSNMNKYYSEYQIRPTSIMLKVRFKIL